MHITQLSSNVARSNSNKFPIHHRASIASNAIAMSSASFFDRFTSPRNRSPILPLHSPPPRSSSEYNLDELDPSPDDALLREDVPQTRMSRAAPTGGARQPPSPESWKDRASSVGSVSKLKPRPMFAGPPPPIAASMVLPGSSRPSSGHRENGTGRGLMRSSRAAVHSVMFDQTPPKVSHNPDSVWRGLRRREQALERDVQQLLDLQATGLVAGSGFGAGASTENDLDGYSDTGSSTPTGTFYSTATSKSRMANSLYMPTRSTPDGNVIPVRQPARGRPLGLRAARKGLRKSMAALADLKQEEDAHVDTALAQRKRAIVHLNKLNARRTGISAELHTLEDDEEEPLGQELRALGTEHHTLSRDIRQLEEKLVGMRNRRRWLREKMDDVKNKREAGLSGYRGALKDADAEVDGLMRRPPIQPLDQDILMPGDSNGADDAVSPGGLEFMRLLPERRTVEMAKTWWEEEIAVLERRKAQIREDKRALEDGTTMWSEVMSLVTDFESSLRQVMKPNASITTSSAKGKEKVPTQEDMVRSQLPLMDKVVAELERRMEQAEEKHWNLLICAIGAELEAFKEAYLMLKGLLDGPNDEPGDGQMDAPHPEPQEPEPSQPSLTTTEEHHDESDNEVPADLLVSHTEESDHHESMASPTLHRVDSENEVPPEFLAEHGDEKLD